VAEKAPISLRDFAGGHLPVRELPVLERTDSKGSRVENHLLLSVSEREFDLLSSAMEFVNLDQGMILHEPGSRVESAYFLNSGLVSLIVLTQDGGSVEVGVTGREGMAAPFLALGIAFTTHRAVVQSPGTAFRISSDRLDRLIPGTPQLRLVAAQFATVQSMQIAQSAACNRLHDIEQRLARWLLVSQDRIGQGRSLPLTHDALSAMLGTDRPTVSLAAKALQRRSVIEYTRGEVHILNRTALELTACECYEVIRGFNSFLGLENQRY
jgi:CRP-like cAMP-binding protein